MGNIYGVANPLPAIAGYIPGGDVACPAATSTTVITTGALTSLGAGDYYPIIWLTCAITMGATAPTALQIQFILGAGSVVDSVLWPVQTLVNAATVFGPVVLVGVNSATAWVGAGSTINIQVNPTGQAVTFRGSGARAIVGLFRGPDA